MMILSVFCIACLQTNLNRPPVGATYSANINFYFIGEQNINLFIKTDTHAVIQLGGIVKSKDTILYNIDENGLIEFKMNHNLQNMLNKMLISIHDAKYEKDIARISVFVKPIRYRKNVKLKRVR